jgi:hypothetical protein
LVPLVRPSVYASQLTIQPDARNSTMSDTLKIYRFLTNCTTMRGRVLLAAPNFSRTKRPMNLLVKIASTLLLGLACAVSAAKDAPFVSKTFQEIQTRVESRDPESRAILQVKSKEDAPQFNGNLSFSIEKDVNADEVVIRLYRPFKRHLIYEEYHLRADDAIRQELANQARHVKVLSERAARDIEEQKKQIAQYSGGQLRYGMSPEEVVKIKGEPERVLDFGMVAQMQPPGTFVALYADMALHFRGGRLACAYLPLSDMKQFHVIPPPCL